MTGAEAPWKRQIKLWAAYAAFYNPLNLLRVALFDRTLLRKHRLIYQLVGIPATLLTGLRTLPYLFRLLTRKHHCHTAPPPVSTVPVRNTPRAFSRIPPDMELPSGQLPIVDAPAKPPGGATHAAELELLTAP